MRIFQSLKETIPLSIIISFELLLFLIPLFSQEKLQEKVLVKAFPIYVRVYQKSELVKDLKKEDFEIYENKVKKEIKGFEVISRKISSHPQEAENEHERRLFIIVFNIFDYFKGVEEGIDYFFGNIYRKDDIILIVVENRLLYMGERKDVLEISKDLKEVLKKYKNVSSRAFSKAFINLKMEADRLYLELKTGGDIKDKEIGVFIQNYKSMLEEYKRLYINPDLSFYKNLINRVKNLKGEKWAIVFQQRELFPTLRNYGRIEVEIRNIIENLMVDPNYQWIARNLQVKLSELQRSFDISNYPWDRLKNIFTQENITYHLLLLSSRRNIVDEDFELREVSQDYEASLKDVSFSTGGSTIFSNKTIDSLKEIEQKEDFYYLLWFTPSEIKGERKIEVKVKREGVKVFYAKEISGIVAPQVRIKDFRAGNKTIEFKITDFNMEKFEGKMRGVVEVKMTIYDEKSSIVFSEGKTLTVFKKEVRINLKLGNLKEGNYFSIVEVKDKISNSTDVISKEIKL